MKPFLKNIIRKLQLAGWLDSFLFTLAKYRNRKINRRYLEEHPNIILPDDYDVYETYQLNYQKFIEDGNLAAKEMIEWTTTYLNNPQPKILDWGCGVGRMVRHIKEYHSSAMLFACDIDQRKIEWNKKHYPNIDFSLISYTPPTHYANEQFDLICGISIFTHIDAASQDAWLKELQRLLHPNGILFISTQGQQYSRKLSSVEKKLLNQHGIFTQSYHHKGHRMMSTYHHPDHFKTKIAPYFLVKEFYDGESHPEKMGGQDLWILQKK